MNVLTLIFCTSAIIQLVYYFLFHITLKFSKDKLKNTQSFHQGVSVVICAHNEEKNLEVYLPCILEQKYTNYEVILVIHNSGDNSLEISKQLALHDKRVHIYELNNGEKGKKSALKFGIQKAHYEVILLTDADCKPASNDWISGMMKYYDQNLVLGYGPYYPQNHILNKFIRFETFITACLYCASARTNIAFMGVGRNMMYPRSWFFENNQHEKYNHILSGDDDLFVQSLDKKKETSICLEANTFMFSSAPNSYSKWLRQKLRHIETGFVYNRITKLYLGVFIISGILYYVIFLYKIVSLLWLFVFFFVLKLSFIWNISKKLGVNDLKKEFIYLDLMYFFYWPFIGIMKLFIKDKNW